MTLQDIGLKPATLKAVQKKAKEVGKTPREYVRFLIESGLLAEKTFDEILKPVREGFKRSGITEDELDTLVTRARKDIYAQSKRKAGK
jgi:hypothetical protein